VIQSESSKCTVQRLKKNYLYTVWILLQNKYFVSNRNIMCLIRLKQIVWSSYCSKLHSYKECYPCLIAGKPVTDLNLRMQTRCPTRLAARTFFFYRTNPRILGSNPSRVRKMSLYAWGHCVNRGFARSCCPASYPEVLGCTGIYRRTRRKDMRIAQKFYHFRSIILSRSLIGSTIRQIFVLYNYTKISKF
jgi:hypothetical protein